MIKTKLKKFKPVTPSFRHRLIVKSLPKPHKIWSTYHINKRFLIKGLKNHSGRNNQGVITSYHRGGGHKKSYRLIDFFSHFSPYSIKTVLNIEYSPFHSGNIALVKNNKNEYSYILAPENLSIGSFLKGPKFHSLYFHFPSLFKPLIPHHSNFSNEFNIGDSFPLSSLPIGSSIFHVELFPGSGAKIARSAGTSCTILKTLNKNKTLVKLPSDQIIELDSSCIASIGSVSNPLHHSIVLGKAGASRWLGIRPRTRGEAMNAVDHPHGGKNHGPGGLNNQPKNRFGKLAKWQHKNKSNK